MAGAWDIPLPYWHLEIAISLIDHPWLPSNNMAAPPLTESVAYVGVIISYFGKEPLGI